MGPINLPMTTGSKNSVLFSFFLITLFYLFTRWLIFKGFNGTDDLHYAMLAARMIQNRYNPFVPDDIFSGRILLIGFQSLIYRIGGINVLSTLAGTLLASIFSCYLTVFKLLNCKSPIAVILAASLFYFNPVLSYSTLGILPDSYVMLAGIGIILLEKNIIFKDARFKFLKSFILGISLGLSLLIKEITLPFLPVCCLLVLFYRPKEFKLIIVFQVIGFITLIILAGIFYFKNTGDAFFKLSQINNSNYINYCSDIKGKDLLIRLSYGVWLLFIIRGFYPVLFGFAFVINQWFEKGKGFLKSNFNAIVFVLLLIFIIYFPFSLHSYQPVCAAVRHFLFLLPWGVALSMEFLFRPLTNAGNRRRFFWICLTFLILCVLNTPAKWNWLIWALITVFFLVQLLIKRNFNVSIIIFCGILWVSLLENVFFHSGPWFRDMQAMSRKIPPGNFYFPDHDNMMNWELLYQFDEKNNTFYNLEKNPFFIFSRYYTRLKDHPFKPGWFIINNYYTSSTDKFISAMDSLKNSNAFSNILKYGHLEALYIDNPETLKKIQLEIESNSNQYSIQLPNHAIMPMPFSMADSSILKVGVWTPDIIPLATFITPSR
jgi:hypothetical protein